MSLISEIYEQPDRLEKLIIHQYQPMQDLAQAINRRGIQMVLLAARGTSDNAGRFAKYLLGNRNHLPVALAAPSLYTNYQTPPQLKNTLVIGISQSGQSPDIVSVLQDARKQNCLSLAITNNPDSPLGKTADFVIDLQAGPEHAVAATKTYTAELMVLALLATALNEDPQARYELESSSGWVDQVLKLDDSIAIAAQRYRYMQQCVVLGRGYNYCTAYEWALKLKELTYVSAEAYSSADFMHGPIAIINGGFPVMAVVPQGKVFPTMFETITRLKNQLKAELVVISNAQEALQMAEIPIEIPEQVPEWLSPIPSIVAGQLFTYHLTRIKGNDPENPRTIIKVTETH